VSTLVPSQTPNDRDLNELRSKLSELEAAITARGTELERFKTELAAFKVTYRQEVGLLHEELDALEQSIAEVELGALKARLAAAGDSAQPVSAPESEASPRYTSDAVRKLFRDVAKAIHPDRGREEVAQDWRHALMVEANRAYALGDEERLRSILQAWEKSPEAVQGNDPEATRLRMVRRMAQMEEQLERFASELASLKESPLGKMKTMVDEAASRGKDLVRDMIARLKRDIVVARNRLDALQWRS
jgi:hypothetical protein